MLDFLRTIILSTSFACAGAFSHSLSRSPQRQSVQLAVSPDPKISRRIFTASSLTAGIVFPASRAFATAGVDGVYWDPYHPQGLVSVKAEGDKLQVFVKYDVDTPATVLSGVVDADGHLTLEPGGLKATYVNAFDNNGIVFSDGKRWLKSPPMAGLYTDPNHPEGSRLVTVFPVGFGSDYLMAKVTGSDGPGQPSFKLTGKLDGPVLFPQGNRARNQVSIDFSPKGGPSNLMATFDGTGLVFPDGNKWPKVDVFN